MALPLDVLEKAMDQKLCLLLKDSRVIEGKLSLIGPVVHEESRTVLGRVILPNPRGIWKPGIFVKGQIHSETSSSAVVVPAEAVQNIEGENVIFVPYGDGFKPIDVAVGKSIKGKTEILAGIKAGEHYVSKGAFELKAIQVTSGAGAHAGHGH
jgi:cobalt-zinc-cadmium efflux system membrane fusion protein